MTNTEVFYLFLTIAVVIVSLNKDIASFINKKIFSFSKKKSNFFETYHFASMICLLIIGLAFRAYKFATIPEGINQDEAMGSVDALALSQYGTDRFGMKMPVHFTAWGFGQMSVLLSYITVPFIKIFGFSTFSVRLPVLVVSMVSLYVLYDLCKRILGQNIALVVLALSVINPWHFMQSRWGLDCNMLPHFFLFSVYFLYLAIDKKWYLYLSMAFFGFTMYTYGIAFYVVPLFLISACAYMISKKIINMKTAGLAALTYLIIAWPIFAVIFINYFKLPSIDALFITIPFFPGTQRMQDILFFSKDFYTQFTNNIKSFSNVVIFQIPDLPWNAIPRYGSLYLAAIPLTFAGLVLFIKEYKITPKDDKSKATNLGKYLLLTWIYVAIFSGIIINNVNINRINIIFYPLIIFGAFGIYQLSKKLNLSAVIISLVFVVSFSGFVSNYFGPHKDVLASNYFAGFGDALDYVDKYDYSKIYVTSNSQFENAWHVSEIMTVYYDKLDAKYLQGKKEIKNDKGVKLLPFRTRYNFVSFAKVKPNPAEDAVFIVNNKELNLFDQNSFKVKQFKYYSAVIPNNKQESKK